VNFGRTVGSVGGSSEPRLIAFLQRALDRERPPARVTPAQASDMLGFEKDDLALLAAHGLLTPLGAPVANAVKYYAMIDVVALGEDRDRLNQATELIYQRNRSKVAAQKVRSGDSPASMPQDN
jgi:hypothetical protein